MAANTAWLSVELMGEDFKGLTAVYLGKAPEAEPEPEPEIIDGDVNGDGEVSIKDVSSLIELLITGGADNDSRALKAEYEAADLNHDGKLSVKDVSLLIELLMGTEADVEQ